MTRRAQLRTEIALNVLAIAKFERLLKTRATRLHRQSAGTAAEMDASMAYRQAAYTLERRKARLDERWAEYDRLVPEPAEVDEPEPDIDDER